MSLTPKHSLYFINEQKYTSSISISYQTYSHSPSPINHWGVFNEVDCIISGVLNDAALCELSKAGEREVLEDILAYEGVSKSNDSSQSLNYSSDDHS